MKNRLFQILLTVGIAANMLVPAFADTSAEVGPGVVSEKVVYTERRDPSQLSVTEIVKELYANESNLDIKNSALKEAALITGEASTAGLTRASNHLGEYVKFGTYSTFAWVGASVPIGDKNDFGYNIGSECVLYLATDSFSDTVKRTEYKAQADLLYNAAWDLKEQTASMNDSEKAIAIAKWIRERVTYEWRTTQAPATCLYNGTANCAGYAALFHVFANFCGLETKTVIGCTTGYHSWNLVKIGTEWKYLDVGAEKFIENDEMTKKNYTVFCISGEDFNWYMPEWVATRSGARTVAAPAN